MPIRHRKMSARHPKAEKLRNRLLQEWRDPDDSLAEPVIIEEGGTQNRPTHLFVVWSEWAGLNQQERSEIIMEAFEELRGAAQGLHVTVAMGLTQEEANRMNIGYSEAP